MAITKIDDKIIERTSEKKERFNKDFLEGEKTAIEARLKEIDNLLKEF